MLRKCLLLLSGCAAIAAAASAFAGLSAEAPAKAPPPAAPAAGRAPLRVVVIPIRYEIGQPALYILRRGLKEAIAEKADVVVLDLKTPGGALDSTFEMMEALEKFPGLTIAYVDSEAMSAGAFISAVTGEIWFAPDGVIGAAAPVTSTGQDVDATMKMKVVSYLKARDARHFRGQGLPRRGGLGDDRLRFRAEDRRTGPEGKGRAAFPHRDRGDEGIRQAAPAAPRRRASPATSTGCWPQKFGATRLRRASAWRSPGRSASRSG